MGILRDKLMGKKAAPLNNDNNAAYKEIFTIIADHDEGVISEVLYCIDNPRIFSKKNDDLFDERGINGQTASEFKIKWIGCVEIMLRHGCAVEFDHNVSFDDFYEGFGKLKLVEQRGILPKDDDIYLDYELTNWVSCIDRIWAKSGLCVGCIDIDSDSYVLFVCTVEQLTKLSKLAEDVGRKITRAAEV